MSNLKTQPKTIEDILRELVAKDRTMLGRPDEFIAALDQRIPGSLARQANPIKAAFRKQAGEMLLVADGDESRREGMEAQIAKLLEQDGIQQHVAQSAAEELVHAMDWQNEVDQEAKNAKLSEALVAPANPVSSDRIETSSQPPSASPIRARETTDVSPSPLAWTCICGQRNSGAFCTACGRQKENPAEQAPPVSYSPPVSTAPVAKQNGTSLPLVFLCIALTAAVTFFAVRNFSGPSQAEQAVVISDKQEKAKESTKETVVSITPFLKEKDQYDKEIAALATDINVYLQSNPDFRNGQRFIDRATDISRRVHETRNKAASANMKEKVAQAKLLEVLDAEIGRIDGLLDGMKDSAKGGDWQPGFKRGTAAAYRFDDVDAELQKVLP